MRCVFNDAYVVLFFLIFCISKCHLICSRTSHLINKAHFIFVLSDNQESVYSVYADVIKVQRLQCSEPYFHQGALKAFLTWRVGKGKISSTCIQNIRLLL